ncbi:MAG: ArsR/SmtB family transcription factor [Methanobrevibacter wolinii]|uniref:ArsR/SmtB family transcription factor n=1 Tax=Methanobrevibacter wolinii TaxID=190977 RepID=UPI0005B2E24E|nr:metalloregulator ArsR/SmtB family transcription factor [Methanobrevibacter wolinii]MDD5960560.1 metalloregulator ArsR/SmtB family transcription factor [Methanobrevibacter wolinii]
MANDICEIKSLREDVIEEVSKEMLDNETYESTASLFKLLGDYNRLRIINALKINELCVCELSILLDMSQSSISHQLRILRHHNIVKSRKENKKVFYSLNNDNIFKLIQKGIELE